MHSHINSTNTWRCYVTVRWEIQKNKGDLNTQSTGECSSPTSLRIANSLPPFLFSGSPHLHWSETITSKSLELPHIIFPPPFLFTGFLSSVLWRSIYYSLKTRSMPSLCRLTQLHFQIRSSILKSWRNSSLTQSHLTWSWGVLSLTSWIWSSYQTLSLTHICYLTIGVSGKRQKIS